MVTQRVPPIRVLEFHNMSSLENRNVISYRAVPRTSHSWRSKYGAPLLVCLLLGAVLATVRLIILWSAVSYAWSGRGSRLHVTFVPLLYPEVSLFESRYPWSLGRALMCSVVLTAGAMVSAVAVWALWAVCSAAISHLFRNRHV